MEPRMRFHPIVRATGASLFPQGMMVRLIPAGPVIF